MLWLDCSFLIGMAGVAAAAPEVLALASSSVTMLWGGGAALPAPPPWMRCHVLVICALADHCMPSVVVLGIFPCSGRVNAFPLLGSAMPPSLAS